MAGSPPPNKIRVPSHRAPVSSVADPYRIPVGIIFPDPTVSGQQQAGDATGWFLHQDVIRGDWAPQLGASPTNPTLGTGGISKGDWQLHAGYCRARFHIHFGTAGSAAGSGTYFITGLPFEPDVSDAGDGALPIGNVHIRNTGTQSYVWNVMQQTTGALHVMDPIFGTELSDSNPFVPGVNDNYHGTIFYKVKD